ncbi:MAG: nucleoside/nucleotide kinase family protein [Lachnospiraceae bacterium]|nr:nucleoside/nucleotide kinase family protein [Lachnospiraceae bacterium]
MRTYSVSINGLSVRACYEEENIREIFLPLLHTLTDLYKENHRRILAFLAAPPGAGKSTLASFLQSLASESPDLEELQAIGMDGFHRRQEYLLSHTLVRDGKEIPMVDVKGTPETFDLDKLEEAIRRIRTGAACGWPVYDRLLHDPVEDAVTVDKNIVLLEGNYLLLDLDGWKRLSSYADYTIQIRAEESMLKKRLVARRIASGHPAEEAEAFVDFSDMYNAGLCLEHSADADLILTLTQDGRYAGTYEGGDQMRDIWDRIPEDADMILHVSRRYLWLPVRKDGAVKKLHFYIDGEKFQELDVKLSPERPDHFFAMDLCRYIGREIEIRGDVSDDVLEKLSCHDEQPDGACPHRPVIHFTAAGGWINDPNGLIYADGIYHLYHQWNPYGTEWGNMHWGHAVSRDLISWETRPMAMEPDASGTMFSGCGWQDKVNAAGFGKNTLLFFYTAAGGTSLWSAENGNKHTQRLAVSADGGETLQKKGLILEHIKGGNRDPKVLWHEESNAYVMVLYLDENEFAVFRSADLLHWEESQRFSADHMWECPDLFELSVEDEPGEKKWVFWSADGYYMTGSFDGFRFEPDSEVCSAYDTKLPYAAQTYAGIPDRTVSVAWYRTENERGGFRGMMSVPAELILRKTESGYRICFRPVRELWESFREAELIRPDGGRAEIRPEGEPVVMAVEWETAGPAVIRTDETEIRFEHAKAQTTVILDHGIMEYYGNNGLLYGAAEMEEAVLSKRILVEKGVKQIRVYRRKKVTAGR